jgi:hypothetical protein
MQISERQPPASSSWPGLALNRHIRERFLTEAEAHGIATFGELNDRFLAWVQQVRAIRASTPTPARRHSTVSARHGPID